MSIFDVIVIGAGHAGIEAAFAASRLGASTLLITKNIDTAGDMSCNPSIGGQGKGHLVREIDIFGGLMGQAADFSALQYRILNRSKGAAVHSSRSQCDRKLYMAFLQNILLQQSSLRIFQDDVLDITTNGQEITGVVTGTGLIFNTKSVIVTAGTFLNGKVIIGTHQLSSGRLGESASTNLTSVIKRFGHTPIRLKTGTPARLLGTSLDFSKMEIQPGETNYTPFSSRTKGYLTQQLPCFITYTQPETHSIINENLHLSPLHGLNKSIEGIGPRYCPSIEDKIIKFKNRDRHQIFVEPMGWNCTEYYPNGISTSLPIDVQLRFLRTIPGFENCVMTRPAYAIEYDAFDPLDLTDTLQSKQISGLFLAGQVNGTSGYEEAGIQGLVAGVNAALLAKGISEPFTLSRTESYGGVLIDDITTKGIDEPYRLFTSRAEFRLSLRDNNTADRLLEKSRHFGLISEDQYTRLNNRINIKNQLVSLLHSIKVLPSKQTNMQLDQLGETPLTKQVFLADILKRPGMDINKLSLLSPLPEADHQLWNEVEVEVKYEDFVERNKEEIAKYKTHASLHIPSDIIYQEISGLSNEIVEKLNRIRPSNIAQASSIPGITPAAITLLIIYLKRRKT